jgi:sodium-dependent dicarboxylate transporter 2/3/5
MAIWWATEAIPVPVTAFLPIVIFEPLGITSLRDAAAPYANPIIYLFLGGFLMALALERWNLHRRIALAILDRTGTDGRRLIGGFMFVCAMLSMWMTNTSTTMMLLPIVLSVIAVIRDNVTELSEKSRSDCTADRLPGRELQYRDQLCTLDDGWNSGHDRHAADRLVRADTVPLPGQSSRQRGG